MEIKAILEKPYTNEQRLSFIVKYNHELGYSIVETSTALEAWGDTSEELLQKAKKQKFKEATEKAFQYLESGEAVFTYEEGKSIEATDGNIAKLGLALTKFILQQDFESTIEWNTKENENVQLNAGQLQVITAGLDAIQTEVWTIRFPDYNATIEAAETIEEVNAIIIDYTIETPSGSAQE